MNSIDIMETAKKLYDTLSKHYNIKYFDGTTATIGGRKVYEFTFEVNDNLPKKRIEKLVKKFFSDATVKIDKNKIEISSD